VTRELQEFQAAKDDAGGLKYPGFEDLREDMLAAISGGEPKTLADAYALAAAAASDNALYPAQSVASGQERSSPRLAG
jgi:hypothetical protein